MWIADRYRKWKLDRLTRKIEAALERNADLCDRFAQLIEEWMKAGELIVRSQGLTRRKDQE
ncbi:MAG: hypothetical protein OXG37_00950 [Actinomycetia bacterium]|nr:hypothetical protein [Actinomycetes bacterium]